MSDSDQRKFANTLNEHVSGCAAAHQRLLAALENLTDDDCRQDSLLPNWSRGHVLTHLSRNADSHVNLLQAAVKGEVGEQYASAEQRNGDIERGSTRSAEELVMDLRLSIYGHEAAWASANEKAWSGQGRTLRGNVIEMSSLVFLRWREVEIHHADLNLGLGYDDLTPLYVRLELDQQIMLWRSRKPMGMTDLPEIAKKLSPSQRLAWLMGRVEVAGLAKPEPL
jgi:maleylpyruvate isomerase